MSNLESASKKNILKKTATLYHPSTMREKGLMWSLALISLTYALVCVVLSIYWGTEPDNFDIEETTLQLYNNEQSKIVIGSRTTAALLHTAETLLNKPGGYQSNDIAPPTVFMDNIANWEFGVLIQVRDLSRSLRNDFSRSQSQSTEDPNLSLAEPQFNFQNDSWILPSSEGEYTAGIEQLKSYLLRLSDENAQDARFYARADNLRDWLATVEKRLGSLSQRLSASVGQVRVNTDLAGDVNARQSTARSEDISVKTPWGEIDDVFYEARGTTWALIHFMQAIEADFGEILAKKNATVSLQQIIRELEATQSTVWSPMVLNGGGFGFMTNYSLVMANYISRANAAVIDLRTLLQQG